MSNSKEMALDEFWSLYTHARFGHWAAKGFTAVDSARIALTEVTARKSIWKTSTLVESIFTEVSVHREAEVNLQIGLDRNGCMELWQVDEYWP